MGKISESFINYMKRKYEKKDIEWKRSDTIIFSFWTTVFPQLVIIPVVFFLMKFLIIDYLLKKKGFEVMVGYAIIIIVIRPLFLDLITRYLKFKDEIKK